MKGGLLAAAASVALVSLGVVACKEKGRPDPNVRMARILSTMGKSSCGSANCRRNTRESCPSSRDTSNQPRSPFREMERRYVPVFSSTTSTPGIARAAKNASIPFQ